METFLESDWLRGVQLLVNKGQKQRNKMQMYFQKAQILILFEKYTRANKIQIEREKSYDCLYKERQKSLSKCKPREKQCVAYCTVFVVVMVALTRPMFTLHRIALTPAQKTTPDRAPVHSYKRWFRRDFCHGAKLRRADLESGASHIG